MKMSYQLSLLIVGVLLAITTTIGSSYALWTITAIQEGTNKVTTGCFTLSYTDTLNNESTSIDLKNAYPISDENGLKLTPYIISLKNTCSIAAKYNLTLTTDLQNTLSDFFLKTNFKDITNNTDYGIKLISELEEAVLDENMANEITNTKGITIGNVYSLTQGILNPDEEIKFELRIWLDESATNDTMSSKFTGVVSNTAYATESVN